MGRLQGRITKEDVREAGLRRWDGLSRVTTDWVNLFLEPELFFTDGDCLVYLREPGQSSRGPAFKVHTARLRSQGFRLLLQRCTPQAKLHIASRCVMSNCEGCNNHRPIWELYLPTAPRSGLEATFDHHITTRNFFAWLYGQPLAGRALGKSLVDLKLRIDTYRPADEGRNRNDLLAYSEAQKYLDFRQCVDHALAALCLAEALHLEDLWIDAFSHCVGLSYCGLAQSAEYKYTSLESRKMVNTARVAMDNKLNRVNQAVSNFFEDELVIGFPGLSQGARDHLDRFRSFLHSYYIEQHGFWPPNNFDTEIVSKLIYNGMYADFYSLYQHLADPDSSGLAEPNVNTAGGVCALQNVRAYDAREGSLPLPHALPQIPTIPTHAPTAQARSQRRSSWNPVARHKEEKERRNAQRLQALINSTNRDWTLMNVTLVRRFSEFEIDSAIDDLEPISLADGRKVRWIVVYAILQRLISVTQAPKQVRNAEGLSYALCCEAPAFMPWTIEKVIRSRAARQTSIEPDNHHSHTNTEPTSPGGSLSRTLSRTSTLSRPDSLIRKASRASTVKDISRQDTITEESSGRSMSMKSSSSRSSSLRRLGLCRSSENLMTEPQRPKPAKRASFCEIYVPGYGNGLNAVELQRSRSEKAQSSSTTTKKRDSLPPPVPKLTASTSTLSINNTSSVSRESSNASSNSTWSKVSTYSYSSPDDSDASAPDSSPVENAMVAAMSNLTMDTNEKHISNAAVHIVAADDDNRVVTGGFDTVHFNTSTWDDMLNVLEKRRFNVG